ncbi:hypothetical protein GCM10023205_74070 [Yinghuangia aomiensis]|uniref:Transposase n=1 Tax=Yinghuangia aomiensis TaxID=676205 RepID=A0ABP9I846_9ACTN
MTPLPEHLRQAARSRSQLAEARARTALAELVKAGTPVTFAAVARRGGVSTDFLYRSPGLRTQIERHRTKSGSTPPDPPVDSSTSAAVRALSARLAHQQRTHHQEVARLRLALEVAQGENLDLRRRLARHEAD